MRIVSFSSISRNISFIIVIYYPSDLRCEEEISEFRFFRNSLESLFYFAFGVLIYVIVSRFFIMEYLFSSNVIISL